MSGSAPCIKDAAFLNFSPYWERRESGSRLRNSFFPQPASGVIDGDDARQIRAAPPGRTGARPAAADCGAPGGGDRHSNTRDPEFRTQGRCISQSTRRLIGCAGARLTPPSRMSNHSYPVSGI